MPAATRPPLPVLIAIALPVLLAVVVAGIGITARFAGSETPAPDTTPLATPPVDAPDAAGPECTSLLANLDGDLPSGDATLPVRALADPAPDGVRAWAAAPRPVVLRCGLPRPQELTPTSALLEIDGVQWLQLDDGVPEPVIVSYVAVDRPVYVVLTTPVDAGSGPLQAVSDVVRDTLPATPVVVR
ncbi:hypothetical protein GCM10017691_14040 [Pseudonocardia petroleophila]|uniref:DUF3515 domain-containing protein n=1 Tax=Pseudonocardia petroleophila TaxID=37331 RepID=A0A7G7MI77_9PSEU|nr:DUF3515 domain-containing protein [Pseudonocardia petroleophila]QNG52488.1 DUF3515 domain-containing protein [Pseudonocardia petroleophila]